MDKREEVKKALEELIQEAIEICKLAVEAKESASIMKFGMEYQNWYTRALKVVDVLAYDRLEEFVSYYRIDPKRRQTNAQNYVIQDFIMGTGARTDVLTGPLWDVNNAVVRKVYNQLQILQSMQTRIDSVLSDVQGSLLSELQDKELETAEQLLKTNLRAAGSLAGVILENHLQKVLQNHRIPVSKKNPTISDMNEPLKNKNIYDITTWRKIQYLADVRNLCSHKKDREPTAEEVRELISGVNEIIKRVF